MAVIRSQLYDSWNRWAFVCRRKDSSDEAALICAGRLFYARAAATRKARSPRVARRVGSTSSVVVSAERRWRWATNSDVGRRLSARYAGAVPCTQRYARTHNRNWIHSGTRNQWRSRSSGVVCSDARREKMSRAAAFKHRLQPVLQVDSSTC